MLKKKHYKVICALFTDVTTILIFYMHYINKFSTKFNILKILHTPTYHDKASSYPASWGKHGRCRNSLPPNPTTVY